ncbi:MAG TPA: FHA domain-containing protein [Pyrinomonadaceae bacterium]|nr:FHA domain-containing protein [Pyrinomonadaceae bacterium]
MNSTFTALGLQDSVDPTTWIIIAVVLVVLFLIVAIVVIGLVIFFVMRKRKKAQADAAAQMVAAPAADPAAYTPEAQAAIPEAQVAVDLPPPVFESAPPIEMQSDPAAVTADPLPDSAALDFDPSRTVAITRENTVTINYGHIKFVSGVLAGQEFAVEPEGAYIGRESTLSQIVVADPRISKRHVWIGVRDGEVKIVDENSRNGTFVNDPRSERVTEATLHSGDTVILGESDVARFEYQS